MGVAFSLVSEWSNADWQCRAGIYMSWRIYDCTICIYQLFFLKWNNLMPPEGSQETYLLLSFSYRKSRESAVKSSPNRKCIGNLFPDASIIVI